MTAAVVVILTMEDAIWAAQVGGARQAVARVGAMRHRAGGNADPWANDAEGAGAELAVARALRVDWPGKIGAGRGWDIDVAGGVEVRWTRRPDGPLYIRQGNPPGHYVLVTGTTPRYRVLGYVDWPQARPLARLGPTPWSATIQSWTVPQAALQDIRHLEALCHPHRPSRAG